MNAGEVLSLLGPSGGGKTSLIKCIYGLEEVDNGEIFFGKEKVLGPNYNIIPGHPDMKLVSQDYYVLDNHSVEENIKDILIGYTNEYKEARSQKILKLLELHSLKDLKAKNLSSGQKQRVAIARALASFPKLLLLDEPFSNLDKILKDKLFDFIIRQAKQKNSAVLLITHQSEEALKYAHRVGVVLDGKMVQLGEKNNVYYKPKNLKIAKVLGDYNVISHEEFEKSSLMYKRNKRALLRPNAFTVVENKKECDLKVTYVNEFFNGKCYEVLAQTKSQKEIVFYTSKSTKAPESLFLKIDSELYY